MARRFGEAEPPSREITDEARYLNRRELMKNVAFGALAATGVGGGLITLIGDPARRAPPPEPKPLDRVVARAGEPLSKLFNTDETKTPWEDVTTYNNYYELGLSKSAPAENAASLRARPWTVRIEGEVARPRTIDIDTLLSWFPAEERVYRMRCVEAWSMVIPWLGFPLGDLIRKLEPTSRAKYIAFETLLDPEQLPGQRADVLDWPYVEGLRIDEAVHPLSILAIGLYGKTLPGQNGAPMRLVVPWKYGFKGIKSIVKIRLTEEMPDSTWNVAAPREYGFYANVNPAVDHPRWSQASERRIGEFWKRPTLPFNGYADAVAHLYRGMDLTRWF